MSPGLLFDLDKEAESIDVAQEVLGERRGYRLRRGAMDGELWAVVVALSDGRASAMKLALDLVAALGRKEPAWRGWEIQYPVTLELVEH